MNRAPWVRRKKRYEREQREKSHAEFVANIERLRNLTQTELDEMIAHLGGDDLKENPDGQPTG